MTSHLSWCLSVFQRQDHLELRMALLEAEQRNQALLRAAQRRRARERAVFRFWAGLEDGQKPKENGEQKQVEQVKHGKTHIKMWNIRILDWDDGYFQEHLLRHHKKLEKFTAWLRWEQGWSSAGGIFPETWKHPLMEFDKPAVLHNMAYQILCIFLT